MNIEERYEAMKRAKYAETLRAEQAKQRTLELTVALQRLRAEIDRALYQPPTITSHTITEPEPEAGT